MPGTRQSLTLPCLTDADPRGRCLSPGGERGNPHDGGSSNAGSGTVANLHRRCGQALTGEMCLCRRAVPPDLTIAPLWRFKSVSALLRNTREHSGSHCPPRLARSRNASEGLFARRPAGSRLSTSRTLLLRFGCSTTNHIRFQRIKNFSNGHSLNLVQETGWRPVIIAPCVQF